MLALTVALVGPYFVDWTTYRADFEREASAILGRKVTVQGDAKARLLPFPSLSFSDVIVSATNAGDPAMTIESFSMDAELAPFLRGEVLIFDMRLVRPKATIAVAEDGTVDWAVRPSAPFDARHISLENLTIEDGEITVRHTAGGRSHVISDIYADVSARALTGPWRLGGSLAIDGVATKVAVSTGEVENGRMRLRIQADPAAYPFTVATDGDARIENGAAVYAGRFAVNARTGSEELRGSDGDTFAVNEGTALPPQYRVAGQFTFDHKLIGIDEFRFETGPVEDPYTAEGTAFIDLGAEPRFAIQADGAQVRFDEAVEEGEGGESLTLAERIAALKRVAAALPNPAMPGAVDVNLPAIVAGDTTIRAVRLSAEPAEGGWAINALSATLPGRTTLEADGFLATGDDFNFSGSLLLAVGQPSGFAAWLSRDVDDAIRRLPAAGFSAKVNIGERKQQFRELELVLGGAKFKGEIDNLQPGGARPSMALRLDGSELDVEGLTAFASLFVSEKGDNRFTDHDLDFEITAGPVHAAGISAEALGTSLRLKEGRLEIDRLSITGLAGASVSATGTLKDFATTPSGNLDASLVAVDLEPLVSLLAERYPANPLAAALKARAEGFPGFYEDATVDVVASAAAEGDGTTGVAISAHGTAAGTGFTMTASAKGAMAKPEDAALTLDFSAQNDDAAALMALYGLPALPLGATGPGDTSLAMKGTLAGGLTTAFHFGGEDIEAVFDGVVKNAGEGLSASGNGHVESGDLEPWLMTAGVALPGLGLGLPVELDGSLSYAGGVLTVADLKGAVADGAVSGGLKAEMKQSIPHFSGALDLDALDLGLAAGMVLGEAPLQAGEGTWPETPFAPASSMAFTADLELAAKSLSAGTFLEAGDARMKLRLDADGLRLAELEAGLHGGTIGGLFELRNNGGTGLFSGQLRFDGADLAAAFPGSGLAGEANLAASLTASGKSVSGMIASISGSGTASAENLAIAGLNPDAFAPILARADAIGRDIDAPKTAAFAPEIAGGGSFQAGSAELAFTVAGGVLRAPLLTLASENAAMTADIRADLSAATLQVTGEVAYEAGEEALIGSTPAIGFAVQGPIGAAELRFDTEPLAQFLTQRALEREQARVEAMQAALLEQQRLRREVRYFAGLREARERLEAQRLQAEQEARRRAEAQAILRAEEEARALAEAEARRIEEEARLQAEEEARLAAEEEARLQAEEEARLRAEEAEARRAEEDARLKAEEETRQQAEDEARAAADEEARRQAEEEAARAAERPAAPLVERRLPSIESQAPPIAGDTDDGLPGVNDPFPSLSVDGLLRSFEQ